MISEYNTNIVLMALSTAAALYTAGIWLNTGIRAKKSIIVSKIGLLAFVSFFLMSLGIVFRIIAHVDIYGIEFFEYAFYIFMAAGFIFLIATTIQIKKFGKTFGFSGTKFAKMIILEKNVNDFLERIGAKFKKGYNAKYLLKRGLIDKEGIFLVPLSELKRKKIIIGEFEERMKRWVDTF